MNKDYGFLLPLLLLLVLAACGGSEPGEAPPAGTGETAAQETAPEEAEAVLEPTAEPAAVPGPTGEPAAEPTAVPEPVEEPAGEGWGESGTTAQSACDHPYFPLREGYTYTMENEGEPFTVEVLSVEGDLQEATAEMQMSSGDVILTYTWQCSAAGGLVSFEFGNLGLTALDPNMELTASSGEGSFLPPPESISEGYSWPSSLTSSVAITGTEGDLEIEMTGEINTEQMNTIINTDPVSFEGRTVPGILLQQDLDMDTAMTAMGQTFESGMSMGGEVQFARGIGMIRQTSFTDFGDFTSQMVEVYVP